MKKAATYVLVFIAVFLSLNERALAIAYTLSTTGNWNVATNWTPNGIPGVADNVTIPSGLLVTVTANADVNDILLSGTSGTRLTVNSTFYLQVWGTMNGPSISFSNAVITTVGTGKVAFRGNARPLFGPSWAGSPHAWTAEINLTSAAQTGTASTNVKFGTLTVTQGIFRVGAPGAYRELRLSMSASPSAATGGFMTIAAAGRVITGICGTQSGAAGNYCQTITVNGALEVHGDTLSGQTITINNGGILSIRKSIAGLLKSFPSPATNFVYNVGSTVEYFDDPVYTGRQDLGAEVTQAIGSNIYHMIADHTTGIRLNQNFNLLGTFTLKKGNVIAAAGQAITYGATSTLIYNGTVAQNAANTGAGEIEFPVLNGPLNLTLLNSSFAGITLFNPRKINGVLLCSSGRLFTTAVNLLTLGPSASAVGWTPASFIHGPIKKIGQTGFPFPVGKNNDDQVCGIDVGGAASTTTFWTETFNNGCVQNCVANGFSGINGTWSVAAATGAPGTGVNGNIANEWFISCSENGEAVGACGAGCGNNATLHVGSVPCALCFLFCPTGDCGAAYNAGPTFGGENPATDKRAMSPTISTVGLTGVTLGFKYIESGQTTIDDAIVEYSTNNGTTWNTLVNTPKTVNTGCGGQGRWTAYSIALPAACDNIATLKIAFRWFNPSDNTGTDPSFAVDDVTLSYAVYDEYTAEYFYNNPQIAYNNVINAPLNHISQKEYWTIVRNVGTSARRVFLSWDSNSGGVTLLADLRVARFNAASWDDNGNTSTAGTPSCGFSTCGVIYSNVVNQFGPFTLASVTVQNPLPVQLINFSGEKKKHSVDLKWTTASELNNDYFTLEKSSDKNRFELLTRISGSGTSNFAHDYLFSDSNPFNGLNYYRLSQTDFNGALSDCGTVAVRFSKDDGITLTAIQQQNEILLGFNSEFSGTITLLDVAGRQVSSATLNNATVFHLPMSGISSGIYLLKISDGKEIIFKRFFY